MNGATLDAGALIAFERSKRRMVALVARAAELECTLSVPAGVVAEVWRDGRRQARLVRLLASTVVEILPLDDPTARAVGQLCGVSGASDVLDASVVLCARARGQKIVTSDGDDLRRIDGTIKIMPI